jgi:hypothetical protein
MYGLAQVGQKHKLIKNRPYHQYRLCGPNAALSKATAYAKTHAEPQAPAAAAAKAKIAQLEKDLAASRSKEQSSVKAMADLSALKARFVHIADRIARANGWHLGE